MNMNSMNDDPTGFAGDRVSLGTIDQYELKRELGGGGFGTVYLAKDTVSGVDVAVKGLPPFVKNNREEMDNIRANFNLVHDIHHPHIAAALYLHPAKDVAYASEDVRQKLRVLAGDTLLVMAYAPGVTLSQWRKQFPGSRVPVDKALEIVRQVAEALDYAHERKVVHRDVKPANVMIETDGSGKVTARVLDFGLAAEIRSSMGRVSKEIHDTSGTRPYMAPEQWLGGRQGPATDQYALAVLFHELVTGEVPFASVFQTGDALVMMNVVGRESPDLPSELPKVVRQALAKALAKKADERFDSCMEFVLALEGKIKIVRADAETKKTGARPSNPNGRSFPRATVFAVVALLALAGAGVWYRQEMKEREIARIAAEQKAQEAKRKAEAEEMRRRVEAAAEIASFQLAAKASGEHDHFGGQSGEIREFFKSEIRAFENDRRSGDDARGMSKNVTATNFYVRALQSASALKARMAMYGSVKDGFAKVDTVKRSVDGAGGAKALPGRYKQAQSLLDEAKAMFRAGKFSEAAAGLDSSKKILTEISEALAEAEKRRRAAAAKLLRSVKWTREEAWKKCLEFKLSAPEREAEKLAEALLRTYRDGYGWSCCLEDCRRAKWDDPRMLCMIGDRLIRAEGDRKPDERLALAFYERSVEMGCTNAVGEIGGLKAKLEVKPYFDAVESGNLDTVKMLVNSDNPCLSMTNSNGATLMYVAALHGDADTLAYLETLGHRFDIENASGATPIFAAVANTNAVKALSCLKWLTAKGVDVNRRNNKADKYSDPYPILGAETLSAFDYLLEKGADAMVRGGSGDTLLHKVAQNSSDMALIAKVAGMFDNINVVNDNGETPLHAAVRWCRSGNPAEKVRFLIAKGADVGAEAKGCQALHIAAASSCSASQDKRKCAEAVAALCSAGADVNAYIAAGGEAYLVGKTALMAAVECGNLPAVKALLDGGADASLRSKNGYEKGYLAQHLIDGDDVDDAGIVDELLSRGCKIDAVVAGNEYHEGFTLLHLICNSSSDYGLKTSRFVSHLIAKGASKELRSAGGTYKDYTPLGLACKNINYSATSALLAGGCNVRAISNKDEEPVHIIADAGSYKVSAQLEILDLLLKYGADVNAAMTGANYSHQRGTTPLYRAADAGYAPWEMVSLLLERGAMVDAKRNYGDATALWAACEGPDVGKSALQMKKIALLLQHGADPFVRNKFGHVLMDKITDPEVRRVLEAAAAGKPRSAPVSEPAAVRPAKKSDKLLGTWVCRTVVKQDRTHNTTASPELMRHLPVTTSIEMTFRADGTVTVNESAGRTFGLSSGTWRLRHGMLMMNLTSADGISYELSAMVRWKGADAFELRYDNGEYAGLIKKRCAGIADLNAVVSHYSDGKLNVSISTKVPNFKSAGAVCDSHVFRRVSK